MDRDNLAGLVSDYPHPEDAIDEIPDSVTVYGNGIARIVVQDPLRKDCVLKLSVGLGVRQNKSELKISELIQGTDLEKYFLPVIDSSEDSMWIVVPKATDIPDSSEEEKIRGENSEEIYEKCSERGLEFREIETGLYDGNYVAVDFGSVKDIPESL